MDRKQMLAVEQRLALCNELAAKFTSEPTATHIRELKSELSAELRRLKMLERS
jgi:tagatose-1,6-bisphosphate aldolase